MRKSVPFALALLAVSVSLPAQEVGTRGRQDPKPAEVQAPAEKPVRGRRPAPAPAPAPAQAAPGAPAPAADGGEPEGTPKKKNFLQRIFGKKDRATPAPEAPAATPAPAPSTPKPRTRTRTRSTTPEAKPEETEKPEQSKTPEPAPEQKKPDTENQPPAATPSKKTRGKKGSTPPAAKTDEKPEAEKTKEQIAVEKAVESGDQDAIEKAKYDEVRSRALTDEKVKELKEKADAATTDEEGRKALRAYNKALFQKMRSLDGSIRDRVDRMETAVMKRLEGKE